MPHPEPRESDDRAHDDEDTRLRVDGVETPIHTRVTRRSESGLTVEQALPFLQLRTRVHDQSDRPARIESVSMVVYDGMPRLVLDLAYEAAGAPAPVDDVAAPIPAAAAPEPAPGVMRPRRAAGVDETQSFERPRDAPALTAAVGHVAGAAEGGGREATLVFDTIPPAAPSDAEAAGVGADGVAGDEADALAIERMHADRLGPRLQRAWAVARPRLQAFSALAVAKLVAGARWALPRLRRGALLAVAFVQRRLRRVT